MVKFDVGQLKYMSKDDFRVLTAVEMGMKNHELVPKQMIANIAGIRGAGAFVALQELHKHKMVWHSSAPYEGFKLTYQGYDALAMHAFERGGLLKGVGRRVGCGKESDIYVVTTPENRELAMKMHRLGRTSFRAVKSKRDYLKKKKAKSWLYLSRLAAMKEYAFMKVLHAHGFPVPEPVGVNRHAVLMEMCPGTLLAHVDGGTPNIVFEIDRADAWHFGYLVYFFEKACGISGYLLGVNPFDQPGVEAYKKNMFALLGKKGYEQRKKYLEGRM